MALESPWGKVGFLTANSDLSSAGQFCFVKAISGGIALADAGGAAIGVLQNNPKADEAGDVMCVGVSKVYAGGSITMGDALMSDASGKAVTHTSTNEVLGIALHDASSGDLVTVLLAKESASGLSANYSVMSIPVKMANIADGDIVKAFTPGFAGVIQKVWFVVTDPTTTAAKASTLNVDIGTTPTTGGAIALTSANTNALGDVVNGSAITAANTFTNTDTLKVVAASTTAFVEGEGVLMIVLKSAA